MRRVDATLEHSSLYRLKKSLKLHSIIGSRMWVAAEPQCPIIGSPARDTPRVPCNVQVRTRTLEHNLCTVQEESRKFVPRLSVGSRRASHSSCVVFVVFFASPIDYQIIISNGEFIW